MNTLLAQASSRSRLEIAGSSERAVTARSFSLSPAGCAPARPSSPPGARAARRSLPKRSRAKAFPPSCSIASTGSGTWPRSSPASARCITRAPRRSCGFRCDHAMARACSTSAPRHRCADDQHRSRCARASPPPPNIRRSASALGARSAQCRCKPECDDRIPAGGERRHAHFGDDRDAHRARECRRDRRQLPGIDALFIGPYDLSTALSGGKEQDSSARGGARDRPHLRGRAEGRQDSRRSTAAIAERALALASAASNSSRLAAISASCATAIGGD